MGHDEPEHGRARAARERRPGRQRAASLLGALAFGLGAGCAEPEGSTWIHLARLEAEAPPEDPQTQALWFETRLTASDWSREQGRWNARPDLLSTDLPFDGLAGARIDGTTQPVRFASKDPGKGAGVFGLDGSRLWLRLPEGEGPPAEATLALAVSPGERVEPVLDGGWPTWRVRAGGLTTDGLALWPGRGRRLTLRPSGDPVLRFAVSCLAPATGPDPLPELTLRVGWNGIEVWSQALRPGPHTATEHLEVPLTPGPGQLELAVEGPSALVLLHAPVVGPAPTAAPNGRPDLVVFLADTFRADNLAAYGGTWGVTPALDRLATEAIVFERARSPSAWTLPSHASLFFGLYPHEHGATKMGLKPGAGLVSVAEQLAVAGYRTVALTDGNFVSSRYDLDRGFQWFEELPKIRLDVTLLRAVELLAAADGRPTFFFIQTYRVHAPYRVTDESLAEHGERLSLAQGADLQLLLLEAMREAGETASGDALRQHMASADWQDVFSLLMPVLEERVGDGAVPGMETIAHRLHQLYLGGVADFDRGFGLFVEELKRRRLLEDAYLVFTSDHGEAFGEHDLLYHARGIWEELLRVPLLIRGPGLTPGRRTENVSLVDLPVTLAELAGAEPHPTWHGRSLLAPARNDRSFAFDCAQGGRMSATVVEGDWKLTLPANTEALQRRTMTGLFHLGHDPGERTDLLEGDERARAREMLERSATILQRLLEPRSPKAWVDISSDERDRLEAMGYIEGEDG